MSEALRRDLVPERRDDVVPPGQGNLYGIDEIGEHIASLPRWYGMTVNGDCMAPLLNTDDVAVFDKEAWPERGDLAAIYIEGKARDDGRAVVQPWIKRITMPLWKGKLPYRLIGDSNCVPVLSFESNVPGHRWSLDATRIFGLHKFIGKRDELVWNGNSWVLKPKRRSRAIGNGKAGHKGSSANG